MTAKPKVTFVYRCPGDFVRDTRHLSLELRGAYQEILDQIVILGQDEEPPSLPDDDGLIANILGVTGARWRKMRQRLCSGPISMLIVEKGRISQPRIVEEIEKARGRIEGNSKAGKASGEARRRKSDALRERMSNARSTDVATNVEHATQPDENASGNRERTIQESTSTNHQSRFRTDESGVTKDVSRGMTHDPQIETSAASLLRRVIEMVAPQLPRLEDCTLERLIELSGDAWIAAALLLQRETYVRAAASGNYIETMLRNRDDDLTSAE